MGETTCCVCDTPVGEGAQKIGNRPYCAGCYAKALNNRRSVWWAGLPGIGALVAFVAVAALIFGLIQTPLQGTPLVIAGVIVALVPALFWLVFFYMQDVREPEPKQYVLGVFVLGGVLAAGVGIPLVRDVFRTSAWLNSSLLIHALGAILVIGFTQQFLVYAAVRYTIYLSNEFDERIDGIVYCVAAALGYATVLNIDYVVSSGGVNLGVGIIRVAVTTLALASLGGVLGFFLGRCKFEDEPVWWMPVGLAAAAIIDGLFFFLRGEVTTTGLSLRGGGFSPWPGLLLATVVSGATFGVLYWLTRRMGKAEAPVEQAASEGGQ